MLENTYLFLQGISSYKYDVPIPIQMGIYIFIGFIITVLVFIFKDALDLGPYRDTYMWYYMIAIFNIANICGVLYYYYSKNQTFIGPSGDPGRDGPGGNTGINMSCNLCNNNIYLQTTTQYDTISKLDFIGMSKVMVGPLLATVLELLETMLAVDSTLDFSEFGNNLLNNGFNMDNENTRALLTLSAYNEYPLIQDINEDIGLADLDATAYLKRPAGKVGQFALGDIAFGGSEDYQTTGFMVNGDIRCPGGFEPICSFITTKEKTGDVEQYSILRMIPPQLSREDMQVGIAKNDISRRVTSDRYVSLGHVIYHQSESSDRLADPLLFACVRESCCKKLPVEKLRFICIYPGVSGRFTSATPDAINLDDMKAKAETGLVKRGDTEGFFSLWRTPMNTVIAKFSNGSYDDGLLVPEILYQSSESVYAEDSTIKPSVRVRIEKFLRKIHMSKIVITSTIFGATVERVKMELLEFTRRYVLGGTQDIAATATLRKAGLDMTIADISQAMRDIQLAIDNSEKQKLAKRIPLEKRTQITDLIDKKQQKTLSDAGIVSYKCVKAFEDIKRIVGDLSIKIENGKTLWDIFTAIIPQGLTSKIYKSDLTPTQQRILDILCVLTPPIEDIWIIKDECLVLDKIDETRLDLESALEDELGKFNNYQKRVGNDAQLQCGATQIDSVNTNVENVRKLIDQQVGHITGYETKLMKGNFGDFTDENMQILLGILRNLNDEIRAACKLDSV